MFYPKRDVSTPSPGRRRLTTHMKFMDLVHVYKYARATYRAVLVRKSRTCVLYKNRWLRIWLRSTCETRITEFYRFFPPKTVWRRRIAGTFWTGSKTLLQHTFSFSNFFFYDDNDRGGLPALDNVRHYHVGHVLYLAEVVPGTILQSIVLFRAIQM